MTCIVGMVDKKSKKVVMGADSAGTDGALNQSIRKDTKIFYNGEFLIGCTSSFRMTQLLRFSFRPPLRGDKDIYEYMCTDFVNAVRECFKSGGFLQKFTDGDEKGGVFLVAHKDRLFSILTDFQVQENLNGLDACGCGESYALGSLWASTGTAKERIEKALQSAELFSAGVAGPFNILETK